MTTLSKRPRTMRTNSADDFSTDPWALKPLYPHLPGHWAVWEPACGEGRLQRALVERGYRVVATDLKMGLEYDFRTADPPDVEVIVTNPPFTQKDAFLARAYRIDLPFAFLLPLTVFEGQARQALFRRYGVEVIFMPKRVIFTTPNNNVGRGWFATCWVTHGLQIGQALTFWEEPQEPSFQTALDFAPAPPRAPHPQKEPLT